MLTKESSVVKKIIPRAPYNYSIHRAAFYRKQSICTRMKRIQTDFFVFICSGQDDVERFAVSF